MPTARSNPYDLDREVEPPPADQLPRGAGFSARGARSASISQVHCWPQALRPPGRVVASPEAVLRGV